MADAPPPSFRPSQPGRPPREGGGPPTPVGRPPQPTPRSTARAPPTGGRAGPRRRGPSVHRTPCRPPGRTRTGQRRRRTGILLAIVTSVLLAWPVGLLVWANGTIQHVDALSGTADTIMVLHVPSSGPTALISLPRDTYAEIPGHGTQK